MPTIEPMLNVRRGADAISFYENAFGVNTLFRHDGDGGSVVAQLSLGAGAMFWVADESPENQNFSPESLKGSSARMVLTVDDPDAVFARAIQAGAREVWPVADQYGWRIGRVVDPFGHHWEIGKPLG